MNRADILAANSARPPKRKTITIEDWGGSVTIQELSSAQARVAYQDMSRLATFLIIASLINDDGTPVFSNSPEDVALVEQMPFAVSRIISDEIWQFNGIDKRIEELQKNSRASQD